MGTNQTKKWLYNEPVLSVNEAQELGRKLAKDILGHTANEVAEREVSRGGVILNAWQDRVNQEQGGEFDSKKLIQQTAQVRDYAISDDILILPDILGPYKPDFYEARFNAGPVRFTAVDTHEVNGLVNRFSFVEVDDASIPEEKGKVYKAAIHLDNRVMSVLGAEESKLGRDVLTQYRAILMLTTHDYFHSSVLPYEGSLPPGELEDWNKNLANAEVRPENRLSPFRQISNYEVSAGVSHRETMETLWSKKSETGDPLDAKARSNYIELLRRFLEKSKRASEEYADQFKEQETSGDDVHTYMASMALHAFLLVIPKDDPQLQTILADNPLILETFDKVTNDYINLVHTVDEFPFGTSTASTAEISNSYYDSFQQFIASDIPIQKIDRRLTEPPISEADAGILFEKYDSGLRGERTNYQDRGYLGKVMSAITEMHLDSEKHDKLFYATQDMVGLMSALNLHQHEDNIPAGKEATFLKNYKQVIDTAVYNLDLNKDNINSLTEANFAESAIIMLGELKNDLVKASLNVSRTASHSP